jgi:hypothetical protein
MMNPKNTRCFRDRKFWAFARRILGLVLLVLKILEHLRNLLQ